MTGHRHAGCGAQLCYRMCAPIKEAAKCRRLPTAKAPMATRAVNKTAKEGEQNARLLLSRGALSAMAIFRRAAFPSVRRWRCTAPYPLLAPAAPALCLSCFWRGRSPSPAFGAVFLRGGRQLFGAGRIRALADGKMFAKCVPQRPTAAGLRPDALLA